ncbi:ureidoglycolate lyase [Aneurinibacillus sp. REN35]|uniref:ureidoglycolate lyase n=1 Tax=Aneurinibacillus sp. REN35 TaxID=3237286 RepID=UPI003527EC49
MKDKEIIAQHLSSASFKPYGDVIEPKGAYKEINDGMSKKWNHMIDPYTFIEGNQGINLGVLRSQPVHPVVSKMERHFFTSQIFIPMGGKRFLVIVAPSTDESPDIEQVEAFISDGKQGVCFYPRTWHCPLIPLEGVIEFVSIMKNSEVPDVEIVSFPDDEQMTVKIG